MRIRWDSFSTTLTAWLLLSPPLLSAAVRLVIVERNGIRNKNSSLSAVISCREVFCLSQFNRKKNEYDEVWKQFQLYPGTPCVRFLCRIHCHRHYYFHYYQRNYHYAARHGIVKSLLSNIGSQPCRRNDFRQGFFILINTNSGIYKWKDQEQK